MDNKRTVLFGTPLNKSLENESNNRGDEDARAGPLNRRRARIERQQIVTDEQGRRRFHGAFTGGFSAGHYNSVGTVGGFQPKSFVSRRREQRDNDDYASGFGHRPEDYMDDEDFGEFGIAPKKLRLTDVYSEKNETSIVTTNALRPKQNSIGEKILRYMIGAGGEGGVDENDIDRLPATQKSDFHGLGYRPLSCPSATTAPDDCNPLVATLKHGKRLKISGEAFGSGVLDDGDDDANLHYADEYGIDTMANYEFSSSGSAKQKEPTKKRNLDDSLDLIANERQGLSEDFVLARDVESMDICGDAASRYPRPVIGADWRMPVREEPYVPPLNIQESTHSAIGMLKKQVGQFSEKFVAGGSATVKCDYTEGPSGLVQYSDLKALKPPELKSTKARCPPCNTSQSVTTIKRQVLEWRPCTLLCRNFNVPNPYPGSTLCGVKEPSAVRTRRDAAIAPHDSGDGKAGQLDKLAPMASRRSVFNVFSEETAQDADDEIEPSDDEEKRGDDVNEDKPQVVDLSEEEEETTRCRSPRAEDMEFDKGPDVILLATGKREPEVITLSSSSSADESDHVDDDDAYGPPLPPSRQTLQAIDRSVGVRSSSQSSLGLSDLKIKRKTKKKRKKLEKDKERERPR